MSDEEGRIWMRVMAALVATALTTACAGAPDSSDGTVVVLAAASLTDAFEAIGMEFEAESRLEVTFSFAGSSALREQVLGGVPADVFASANLQTMETVVEAGATTGAPDVFATNALEIVVPEGNPAGVTGLSDLADEELLVGLCAEGVPCGDLAAEVLAAAGVDASVDTYEADVRALLTKVRAGELDAGMVYGTDVRAAEDDVDAVPIPADVAATTRYPIAVLESSTDPDAAATFVDFVLSEEGRSILADFGFGVP